jgi:hypothetical protein
MREPPLPAQRICVPMQCLGSVWIAGRTVADQQQGVVRDQK